MNNFKRLNCVLSCKWVDGGDDFSEHCTLYSNQEDMKIDGIFLTFQLLWKLTNF